MNYFYLLFALFATDGAFGTSIILTGNEECGIPRDYSESILICNFDLTAVLTTGTEIVNGTFRFPDKSPLRILAAKSEEHESCIAVAATIHIIISDIINRVISLPEYLSDKKLFEQAHVIMQQKLTCFKDIVKLLKSSDKLMRLCSNFVHVVEGKVSRLKQLGENIGKYKVNQISTFITSGDYSSAINYFAMMKNEPTLQYVINLVCSSGKFENVIVFAVNILDPNMRLIAFRAIFNSLDINHAHDEDVFLLAKVVKNAVGGNYDLYSDSILQKYHLLMSDISQLYDYAIQKLVGSIVAGNYEHIVNKYAQVEVTSGNAVQFSECLETLIQYLLGHKIGLLNLIELMSRLPWDDKFVPSISLVLREVKQRDIQIKIAEYLKQVIGDSTKMAENLESLLDLLPSDIKSVGGFGGTCYIEINNSGKYLTAAENRSESSDFYFQRPVVALATSGNESLWILKPRLGYRRFKILNLRYNEYLGALAPYEELRNGTRVNSNFPTTSDGFPDCDCLYTWRLVQRHDGVMTLFHEATKSFLYMEGSVFSYAVLRHRDYQESSTVNLICSK